MGVFDQEWPSVDKDLFIMAFAIPGCYLRVLFFDLELYWISNGYGLTLASFSGFFLSNIFGCIVMGYVVSIKQHITPNVYDGITGGFCGSLTTFSSWAQRVSWLLWQGGPVNAMLVLVFMQSAAWVASGTATMFGKPGTPQPSLSRFLQRYELEPGVKTESSTANPLAPQADTVGELRTVHMSTLPGDGQVRTLRIATAEHGGAQPLRIVLVSSDNQGSSDAQSAEAKSENQVIELQVTTPEVKENQLPIAEFVRQRSMAEPPAQTMKHGPLSWSPLAMACATAIIFPGIVALYLGVSGQGGSYAFDHFAPIALAPYGALVRVRLGRSLNGAGAAKGILPYGTLCSNLIGCFIAAVCNANLVLYKRKSTSVYVHTVKAIVLGLGGCVSTVSSFMAEGRALPHPSLTVTYHFITHVATQALLMMINLPVSEQLDND